MKPAHNGQAILSEAEITITEWHVTASGKRFAWGDLGIVRMVKPDSLLIRLLAREKPLYQLKVAKKGQSSPKAIFSTQDGALAKRIEQAIDEVARKRGATREK